MAFTNDFFFGFVAGMLFTLVLGWLGLLYRSWVKIRNAYNRPQLVITPTAKTPAEVGRASARAELKIGLLYVGILILIWLLIETLFPTVAQAMRSLLMTVWDRFFGV